MPRQFIAGAAVGALGIEPVAGQVQRHIRLRDAILRHAEFAVACQRLAAQRAVRQGELDARCYWRSELARGAHIGAQARHGKFAEGRGVEAGELAGEIECLFAGQGKLAACAEFTAGGSELCGIDANVVAAMKCIDAQPHGQLAIIQVGLDALLAEVFTGSRERQRPGGLRRPQLAVHALHIEVLRGQRDVGLPVRHAALAGELAAVAQVDDKILRREAFNGAGHLSLQRFERDALLVDGARQRVARADLGIHRALLVDAAHGFGGQLGERQRGIDIVQVHIARVESEGLDRRLCKRRDLHLQHRLAALRGAVGGDLDGRQRAARLERQRIGARGAARGIDRGVQGEGPVGAELKMPVAAGPWRIDGRQVERVRRPATLAIGGEILQ